MEKKKNTKQFINSLPYLLSPLYFFSFLFFPTTLMIPVFAYNPSIIITLNCGSAGESLAGDRRKWVGDTGTNYTSQAHNPNASITATASQLSSGVDPIPYLTARIFRSQFTYSFFLPAGPKFFRFHFYPSQYQNSIDARESFFSVKVGNLTFLSNFSASLAAGYQKSDSFFKEFCVNSDGDGRWWWLNVTFIPEGGSYAFVNGIEIVSMPDFLYYRRSNDIGIPIVGQSVSLSLENTTALETVYRLNVGGQSIPPVYDTGMFRSWSMDNDFLYKNQGVEIFNFTIQIKHSEQNPAYSAPDEVYQTARSMGPNKTLNQIANLTWNLPVNSGFNYLMRLHFCEILPEITNRQDREFHIDINQAVADGEADVITWSGGNGAAAYRDYVVALQGGGIIRWDYPLLVDMRPNPESLTRHSDTILIGIELFKLLNATLSLAGPNPELDKSSPAEPPPPRLPGSREKKGNKAAVMITVGSVIGGAVATCLLIFLFFLRRRTSKPEDEKKGKSNKTTWSCDSWTMAGMTGTSSPPSNLCRHFSIVDIRRTTNNFNDAFLIGVGGFGNVYKGYMDDNMTAPVAIKRLNSGSQQGAYEFHTEIQMLSKLRHRHLVSLIGYCDDDQEMILVYDCMAHGTLRDHLYGTDNPPLSWNQRLEICVGAARGLHYLHTSAKYSIIHRDVKTTNILLDEKWVAKVSDFGLSRVGPTNPSDTHVSTLVKGSFGYMDPEYFLRQQLTVKSDVYSFGVVLFEVLCGRPPLVQTVEEEKVNLAEWARNCYENGTLVNIIDRHLMGKIAPECLKKFGELAMSCVHDKGIRRPSMNDVMWTLEFVQELQRTAEERIKLGLPRPQEREAVGDETMTSCVLNLSDTTSEYDLFSLGKAGALKTTKSIWNMSSTNGQNQSEESCHRFSFAEIRWATHNFDDALLLGKGGFGKVYKGFINYGSTVVAVKRLNTESKQGAEEFWSEIKTLSKLRHPHLVTLIGYSDDCNEMILVYEYMANGTLADNLYKTRRKGDESNSYHLTWEQRLNICIGAAQGLDFLHNMEQNVIHRDVKTTNILLDENWVAKISDFGLSKMGTSQTHVSTDVKGTFGYLDPEYFLTRRLTKKSDVYAFGVVLFEVLCARPSVDIKDDEEEVRSLPMWAQQCLKKGMLDQIIDPYLRGQISTHLLKLFGEVANKCLHNHPQGRPTMAEVAASLELMLASHGNLLRRGKRISKVFLSLARVTTKGIVFGRSLEN